MCSWKCFIDITFKIAFIMNKRNDKHSLLESFKLVADQYLRSTTAHGFKYLVEGRNICEVVVWSIVIFFCFGLTLYGIYSSVKGSYDNPILTSVQTTQIQKVSPRQFNL